MGVVLHKIGLLLEMIQFKLTVFAMPFALMGAFLSARGLPGISIFLWIVVAMVGARSCAMAFNRIVDRRFDKANPRTSDRAIPAGEVKLWEAWALTLIAGLVFFLACWQLNSLTLSLSPLALSLTLLYSLTKRFTYLCHIVLGIALAFAPFGGWVAVSGSFAGYPFALSLAVVLWVAGFDMLYACLDADFDRRARLHSMPAKIGRRNSFRLAGLFHVLAFVFFLLVGIQSDLNFIYFLGVFLAGCALFYQHRLVRPQDLSRIHVAFFRMNGIVSMVLFLSTWVSLITP